jgi:glycosidase
VQTYPQTFAVKYSNIRGYSLFYYSVNSYSFIKNLKVMRRGLLLLFAIFFSIGLSAQIVSLQPSNAGPDDFATLIFDANEGNGELGTATKVYMHHGVVTESQMGTAWQYTKGNWGADDGIGLMEPVVGQPGKWQIAFTPSIREYFGVPAGENIFRISAVFRSADGNTKGSISHGNYGWGQVASNGDYYINLNLPGYVTITNPTFTESYLSGGESLPITAVASSNASNLRLLIDEGAGFEEKASVTSGSTINYTYRPTKTVNLGIKVTATINNKVYEEERAHQVVLVTPANVAELPTGIVQGINYNKSDHTKVTLALEAPGKLYVYAVGDFSGWQVMEQYKMNRTPDGEHFWVEINNLEPKRPYVFQYWIDGKVKVGDPYADQVADPWNDNDIEESVFPNMPNYSYTEYGIATVFETGQIAYEWSEQQATWERPDLEHLVIYELHIRDFLATHSYSDLIDTLSYLKRLGIDAIELMPVNEFEGNSSWGYNPSYYFAPDKYYGHKNELKRFIDVAHQNGIAVILDMVLNHAFGQNAMVKMYWDEANDRPSADNPWFNTHHVGPFEWGFDFDHESEYTQRFVDRVNRYWIEEYKFDGYRFDFTKGFTNNAPGGSIDGYDQSRINILKRMADVIWEADPEAYVILEHWGPANEEAVLAAYGMKMWRNRSYDFVPDVLGYNTGSFANMGATTHVSYFNSHDERRIAEHALTEGMANGSYNVKEKVIMFERVKMAAAFAYLNPGPKMIWQFDELGYDIHIDYNGRTGRKPLPWGNNSLLYYNDPNRQNIYDTYRAILEVRKTIGPDKLALASVNHKQTGPTRRLSYNTSGIDLVVIGNFGLETANIEPAFTQTGSWFNYFTGEEINVTNTNALVELKAGEWHIFTTERLSNGLPGVVEVFDSPVSISPYPFTMHDEITLTFDASKAWKGETNGLVGSSTVNIIAGLITDDLGDLGETKTAAMTHKGGTIWEITMKPSVFFGKTEALKLGMFFSDEAKLNHGFGFRNTLVIFNILSQKPIVTITPAVFNATDEITITFHATQGNRELMGASKVYIHSSVGTVNTDSPQSTAWDHAVGNWGTDDGIGLMTQVEPNTWQIKLMPRNYYNLAASDFPFWLAAVFRNANGTLKGTAAPGEIENGFVASNLDFFIRNQDKTKVVEQYLSQPVVYPNPAYQWINVSQFENLKTLSIYNHSGSLINTYQDNVQNTIDVSMLNNGIYFYQIETQKGKFYGKFIKK